MTAGAVARPKVGIQGLGFVGAAMAAAVARAQHPDGTPRFDVIGVDLPTRSGRSRVDAIRAGRFPFRTSDATLEACVAEAVARGNLTATTDTEAFRSTDVAIVDIHLDVDFESKSADFAGLRAAVLTLAQMMAPGGLVIIETTVPPGTCRAVIAPEIEAGLAARGLARDALRIAHSYERVMPGPDYLDSIVNFWRVFAGIDDASADACRAFLEQIIDTTRFPLTQLSSTTASELAKVMENTYRATTIALMDEWGRFAEAAGVDMFEVVDAIRVRPTHNNIRQPGLGVGGYCLTKDPLFGVVAANSFGLGGSFPLTEAALAINREMPLHAVDRLREALGGTLNRRRILLLGVAYRSDVDDTRHAPSEMFFRAARDEGATVSCHDPMVAEWAETGQRCLEELPAAAEFDAVVFAVAHRAYAALDIAGWLAGAHAIVLDANAVLSRTQRDALAGAGIALISVGRGGRPSTAR